MSSLGTYLYGITRAGTEVPAGLKGIEDDASVCTVDCAELAALTSLVPREAFESDRPADPAWVIPRALKHELVIETMLAHGPILPVRFGSVFKTRAAVEAWVSSHRYEIAAFLEHVAGKQEWTVKVSVELEAAYERLVAADLAWAAKAGRASALPGTRYFQEKKLREEARKHVRHAARAAAVLVRNAARAMAEERVLPLRGPDRQDVEPVSHLAYLVPIHLVSSFHDLTRQVAGRVVCLRLEFAGPWPPSHFCPVLLEDPHARQATLPI